MVEGSSHPGSILGGPPDQSRPSEANDPDAVDCPEAPPIDLIAEFARALSSSKCNSKAELLGKWSSVIAACEVMQEELSAIEGGIRSIGPGADPHAVKRIRAATRRISKWIPKVKIAAAWLVAFLHDPTPVMGFDSSVKGILK